MITVGYICLYVWRESYKIIELIADENAAILALTNMLLTADIHMHKPSLMFSDISVL